MCTENAETLVQKEIKELKHQMGNHLAVIGSLIAVCKRSEMKDPDFERVINNADKSYVELVEMMRE